MTSIPTKLHFVNYHINPLTINVPDHIEIRQTSNDGKRGRNCHINPLSTSVALI